MSKKCFHGGASFDAIGTDFGRLESKAQVIRADVTDAWYGPAPDVVEIVGDHLAWLLRNSPPTSSEGLVKAISEFRGIPADNLVVGGGSSDLIFAFFPNHEFDSVTILDPMYGEYAHIFENVLKKDTRRILQNPKDGFNIDVDDIVKGSAGSDMVVMVNPNNPTGRYLKKKEIQELLTGLPEERILFIDETYIDFIGKEESAEKLVTDHENLVVLKSMSKVYGLSGARVGYLAAHANVIEKLRKYMPPWSVGLIGQVAGIEALKNEEYYKEKIAETHKLREELASGLEGIPGVVVYPGSANYILLGIKDTGKKAQDVCDRLVRQNIFVRNATSMSSRFDQDFIRTAVKDKRTNDKICFALEKALTS